MTRRADTGVLALARGLRSTQKPGFGVPAYMRWVNRGLARYPAALAFRLGVSPNAVTAVSGLLSLLGMGLIAFAPMSIATGIGAAALLAAGFVLDSADGQLARLSGRGSAAGEWLDHVVDAVRTPALHLAVLIGLWRVGAPPIVLAIPVIFALVSTGQFTSQILAEQLAGRTETTSTPSDRRSWLLLPIDPGVLMWSFVLWAWQPAFVTVYAVLAAVAIGYAALSMRRKYRGLAQKA
jgi:phosphatidylglycerophosphate synthase